MGKKVVQITYGQMGILNFNKKFNIFREQQKL